MRNKKKAFEKNILIFCEGQVTEPNYLGWIAEKYASANGFHVEIRPNRDYEESIIANDNDKHSTRKKQKRRLEFQSKDKSKEKAQEFTGVVREILEKKLGKNVPMPLNYVLLGKAIIQEQKDEIEIEDKIIFDKLKLKEFFLNEIWVVYDKDGHSHHIEALAEAQKNDINVALSSRSFEIWLLFHFERTLSYFKQTQCKEDKMGADGKIQRDNDRKKRTKAIPCSLNLPHLAHSDDCQGNICLVGYLRKNSLLKNYQKSDTDENLADMMNILLKDGYLETALENAAWVRYKNRDKTREICTFVNDYLQDSSQNDSRKSPNSISDWEISFTNIDFLIKRLLNISKNYIWCSFDEVLKGNFLEGLSDIKLSQINLSEIIFSAKRLKLIPQIYLKNKNREVINLKILETAQQVFDDNKFTIQIPEIITKDMDLCIDFTEVVFLLEM